MEELVIPLKFDSAEALRQLRALAAESGHLGAGLDDAGDKGNVLGHTMANIISNQGMQVLREGAQILSEGFAAAANHVKEVSKEFLSLQESLRIIATFKSEKLTDESTVAAARLAASMGLTPSQGKAFEEQFFGFAGQFIGDDTDAQGQRTKKFSKAQGTEMEQRAGAFMTARGIEASQGGAIFGELLQQAKPGESTDDIMKKFSQAYTILEAAKGDPGPLMGQMGQVTAQGVDTTTAAKLLRIQAQADPGEAGTHARALLKGFSTLKGDEEKDLGITGGMDIFEKVEKTREAMEKSGEDEAKFLRKRFNNIQEFDAISAAINFGSRGGLKKASDEAAAAATGTTDIEAVKEFKEGEAGRRIFNRAGLAAERVASGARFGDVEDLKVQAEKQLESEHAFTEPTVGGALVRGIMAKAPGGVSPEQQMINERAIELARQQAGETGSRYITGDTGLSQNEANNEILRLLKVANEQREKQAQKPLAAPPPRPEARP